MLAPLDAFSDFFLLPSAAMAVSVRPSKVEGPSLGLGVGKATERHAVHRAAMAIVSLLWPHPNLLGHQIPTLFRALGVFVSRAGRAAKFWGHPCLYFEVRRGLCSREGCFWCNSDVQMCAMAMNSDSYCVQLEPRAGCT